MKGHASLSNPCNWKDDDQLPIENVTWLEIDTAFLPRLNALTGRTTDATKYRLPREAEWEYAARGCKGDGSGGTATCESFMCSGGNNFDEIGWYVSNSSNRTHIVGQQKPKGLGIYDMSGNVWEWCRDIYSTTYYKTSPVNNPENTPTANDFTSSRVFRGSSWNGALAACRVAARNGRAPSERLPNVGFRVVLP
jgi:formylglycine-generating enzyme required for sulfatase activity